MVIENNFKDWCRETIWYGRRSNRFKCNLEKLKEANDEKNEKPHNLQEIVQEIR